MAHEIMKVLEVRKAAGLDGTSGYLEEYSQKLIDPVLILSAHYD